MRWNWQQPDWPRFTWAARRLERAEARFLAAGARFIGSVRQLDGDDRDTLAVELMSDEAVTTSRIEGEILDRESVQSSIRRQLGLATDVRSIMPAEQGISEVMVHLFRGFADPLEDATLFTWHRMVTEGRRDLRDIGAYRTHAEPMQILSGPLHDPKVHFEAPPSTKVPTEMAHLIEWFNRTGPGGAEPLPALTRAGLGHLHFESIHPFEDGNGRVGRALAEKALAQGLGQPAITALAATLLAHCKAYYGELESATRHNSVTAWLAWFAGICLEAQVRAIAQVEFLIDKAKLLDRLRGLMNERQQTALLRMLREGPSGFRGGLSAGNYIAITKASPATATRDLAELVDLGALTRTGELRHTRYHVSIPPRPVPVITIDPNGEVVESASV